LSLSATNEQLRQLEHLARRALVNIAREYPNHPQLYVESDADVIAPRLAHPAFFGCFDWHSAVHSHWLLVRAFRILPDGDARQAIGAALDCSFEPAKLEAEARYLKRQPAFERPYGLAWALLLAAEGTAAAEGAAAARWHDALAPLAAATAANLLRWLAILRYPVRSGTHNQSAFALTLVIDAACALGDAELEAAARQAALAWYERDTDAPLRYEPSGEDFLSPALMEADLMRRVLPSAAFADWLRGFLPSIPPQDSPRWLPVASVSDETDGRAVHLNGLNLSRAWNLANVAAALPAEDARVAALQGAAERHRDAGVAATLTTTHYAGDHWLPTFAVYLAFGALR
jgi:hypothetical protein